MSKALPIAIFSSFLIIFAFLYSVGAVFPIPAESVLSVAATPKQSTKPAGFIFLTEKDCDWEFEEQFDRNIRLASPDLDPYNAKFQVLCFGGIRNFWIIDNITVPIIRMLYPDRVFVFVFDHETQSADFNRYLAEKGKYSWSNLPVYERMKNGEEIKDGWSDIERGVGYADDQWPYNAKHEITHLWTCGTWHDSDGRILPSLIRYPNADKYPWCN